MITRPQTNVSQIRLDNNRTSCFLKYLNTPLSNDHLNMKVLIDRFSSGIVVNRLCVAQLALLMTIDILYCILYCASICAVFAIAIAVCTVYKLVV